MVRTKADSCPAAGRKVVAARAPRKTVGGGSSSSSAGSSSNTAGASPSANKYAGGNAVCPRPTPEWQKGIGNFFQRLPTNKENQKPEDEASTSSSQPSSSSSSESAGASCSDTTRNDRAGPSHQIDSDDDD